MNVKNPKKYPQKFLNLTINKPPVSMYTNNNNQDPNFARKIPLWRNYCAEKNGGEICWKDRSTIQPWNAHRFDSNRFPRLRTSAEPKDRALRAHGFTSSLGFPSVFASRSGCTSSNDRGRALTRSKVDFTTEPRKKKLFLSPGKVSQTVE